WQRCDASGLNCSSISGATGASYTLSSGDVGHKIKVTVTATDQESQIGFANSAAVGPVSNPAAPSNTVLPAVSGIAQDGHTLTVSNGTWSSPDTLSYGYQWRRCDGDGSNCSDISGATASSYTLSATDVGHQIGAVVTATDQE